MAATPLMQTSFHHESFGMGRERNAAVDAEISAY